MSSCPSCGRESPDGFAFCGFCGAALAPVRPQAAARERKIVSVLFCDLVGFTAASERADPEDVEARLGRYYRRLRTEIEGYGGTVDKFIGDAVMAVFGAPIAHEDDPERAVRAGLRILEAIADLNDAEEGLPLRVRLGVNTGEALVSLEPDPEHGQWLVAGDVVNTAARVEQAAPVDSVAVGLETYRQTDRVFVYEELPAVRAKGKAEPLALYRAVEPRARLGTDLVRTHTSPFVGREVEHTLLQALYERTARDRSPQLVTLVGEPGVGKSRLAAELGARLDVLPELVTWRQGRCLPYGDGITFWALGEIVKAHAGIYETDAPTVAERKLEAVLPDVDERPWLRARLLPLLGIESGPAPARDESFTAWRRFLEGIAADDPAVLLLEDLHWADPALLDFLAYLAEWAQGVPLLLLCTARPELYERHPGWAGGMRNATTINLAPLSDAETSELVSALAQSATEETERAVVERAGGNPLYAEEFVRLLSDRGLAAGPADAAFPGTVQALIAARLDTLPPERKSLLQDAAVVGKVFWAGVLAEMSGRERAEVEQVLHELSRKELVRPARTSSMEGEAEYAFWHALVRDVAYAQIPRAGRAHRHRVAAAWIETKAGERVEDQAELLAHHTLQALELSLAAGENEEAAALAAPARHFLRLAGERALGLDAVQAEARLAKALELTPTDDPGRPHLLVGWADAASGGPLRERAAALDEALDAFRAGGETAAAARALTILARVAVRLGEARHVALAAEAVDLLEPQGPTPALVDAYAQLAASQVLAGSPREATGAAERALALAERLSLPMPARALGYHGFARALVGERDGLAEMERALALLVERGAGQAASVLHNDLAYARYPLEGHAASVAAYEDGIAFCRQRGLTAMAGTLEGNRAEDLVALGRPDEALAFAATVVAAAEKSGDTRMLTAIRSIQVATSAARGDTRAALAQADWLVERAREIGSIDEITVAFPAAAAAQLAAGEHARAQALVAELERAPGARESINVATRLPALVRTALAAGDPALAARLVEGLEPIFPLHEHSLCAGRAALAEHAGEHFEAATLYAEAAERWRGFSNVPERAYALLGQGRCLLALGRPGAEEPLREARELLDSMGYRPALAETEALLAEAAAGVS